jgi:4-hydroxy-3-polyprenylbenzoate decarboxylase
MGYRNLTECVDDLERTGQLIRIDHELDPNLEIAEIQRRVYLANGPALYFSRVKGCRFPMVSNLFGTMERTRFLFRDTLEKVRKLVELKLDPSQLGKRPFRYWNVPFIALTMLPKYVRSGPILEATCQLSDLPQLKCWPNDGGAFVTLPAVYTEDTEHPGWKKSNLGMYRVQISGNDYLPDREVGLHYQIHRGIGVHHSIAVKRGQKLRVQIWIGGPPSLPLSAVMPLPEGLSELMFAGALGGRRLRLVQPKDSQGNRHLPMPAEADFCIVGTIDPSKTKPEGPFGDHLGYYSLAHEFPYLEVEKVYHRKNAIWPFTVVGRPPQEDTSFGEIIHEITGPIIPTVLPGVKAVNAVDAAGVHPLLLAIGSERYVPYASKRKPQELLTIANAILGQGQLSLAKYLLIVAHEDNPTLDIHDIQAFLQHLLERVDWRTDLHFQTQTTIDTLDYSGQGFNLGSKVVIAAAGPVKRELKTAHDSFQLPDGFRNIEVVMPGVLAIEAKRYELALLPLQEYLREHQSRLEGFPLIILVDDARFASQSLNNFLWITFTRSNPATDIHGVGEYTRDKHWGCTGPLLIDARVKPHHAPPCLEDPAITRRVDALAAPGGPLHKII